MLGAMLDEVRLGHRDLPTPALAFGQIARAKAKFRAGDHLDPFGGCQFGPHLAAFDQRFRTLSELLLVFDGLGLELDPLEALLVGLSHEDRYLLEHFPRLRAAEVLLELFEALCGPFGA